jgi:hypothetical protein
MPVVTVALPAHTAKHLPHGFQLHKPLKSVEESTLVVPSCPCNTVLVCETPSTCILCCIVQFCILTIG